MHACFTRRPTDDRSVSPEFSWAAPAPAVRPHQLAVAPIDFGRTQEYGRARRETSWRRRTEPAVTRQRGSAPRVALGRAWPCAWQQTDIRLPRAAPPCRVHTCLRARVPAGRAHTARTCTYHVFCLYYVYNTRRGAPGTRTRPGHARGRPEQNHSTRMHARVAACAEIGSPSFHSMGARGTLPGP